MKNLIKKINYFIQFILIFFLFLIFKIFGLKLSRIIASNIFLLLGPLFRSKHIIIKNLSLISDDQLKKSKNEIIKNMWKNYGKILCEYVFIKQFRLSKLNSLIEIEGQTILDTIKKNNDPVVFISGHFDNFELMAMHIEKSGIDLTAIYRPLNNIFLNPIMEKIRENYICQKQIKKGISGTKKILKNFKLGSSIALMIDQRVSQGIRSPLFSKNALTTTIPGQFIKKFKCEVVPIFIERKKDQNFRLEIMKPISFQNDFSVENITHELNKVLEKMIRKNPYQWIWSHDRWK